MEERKELITELNKLAHKAKNNTILKALQYFYYIKNILILN